MSVENRDYAALFATPLGTKVLEALQQAFYERTSFDKDPYVTAYNEGRRAVLIFIHNQIKTTQQDAQKQDQQGDSIHE